MGDFDRQAENISNPEREILKFKLKKAISFTREIETFDQALMGHQNANRLEVGRHLLEQLESGLLELCDHSFTTAQTEDTDKATPETLADPFYNSQYFLFKTPSGAHISLRLKKNLIDTYGLNAVTQPLAVICLFKTGLSARPHIGLYPSTEISLEPKLDYFVYEYFGQDLEKYLTEGVVNDFLDIELAQSSGSQTEILQEFAAIFKIEDIHKGGKVNKIIK